MQVVSDAGARGCPEIEADVVPLRVHDLVQHLYAHVHFLQHLDLCLGRHIREHGKVCIGNHHEVPVGIRVAVHHHVRVLATKEHEVILRICVSRCVTKHTTSRLLAADIADPPG